MAGVLAPLDEVLRKLLLTTSLQERLDRNTQGARPDTNLITQFALRGLGFAYILEDVVAEHIAAGRLVRVLEEWCQASSGFHLYYSGGRHKSAPLRDD